MHELVSPMSAHQELDNIVRQVGTSKHCFCSFLQGVDVVGQVIDQSQLSDRIGDRIKTSVSPATDIGLKHLQSFGVF